MRALIPALQRAARGGPTSSMTSEVRQAAQRYVHAVQHQQLNNVLAPARGEPMVVPLPVAAGGGTGELRIYVSPDREGAAAVDAENVRFDIELDLSRLKRVSIGVQLFRGQLSCSMAAERPETQTALAASAPDLKESLERLGFSATVEARGKRQEAREVAGALTGVNVTA
ncbi:MAG: flagellar hook-length control protein FliK [Chloroflexi bacterium]|nr:flagellar hook-length control protein FliK [Chloroflexota bacterium]